MGIDCFLFDLDGTLIDSDGAILTALRRMEQRLKLRPLSEEALRTFLGPALKDSFVTHYHASAAEIEDMLKVYREGYMELGVDRTVIFDGVFDFLYYIRDRGGKTALATLKEHHLAQEVLSRTGLSECFDHIALDMGTGGKAGLIRECLASLDRAAERAVMFGDSPQDGLAAAEAGVAFVPLLGGEGFRRPGSLDGIPHVFSARTVKEMGEYIRSVI